MEVKIELEWKGVYEAGRQGHFKHTVTSWTGILSSQILELTHKMCTTRCDILHEKSEDGLPLEESRQLLEDIRDKYLLGTVGIAPGDAQLIEKPLEDTLKMSEITKKNWLRSVRISREEDKT